MNSRTDYTEFPSELPLDVFIGLSSFREIYELSGRCPEVAELVLNAMTIHRPNGYGVLTGDQLLAITKEKIANVIPACYGLMDGGLIERLIVNEDHIVFAIKRELSAEVKAIQSQSNEQWLSDYDAADVYDDSEPLGSRSDS